MWRCQKMLSFKHSSFPVYGVKLMNMVWFMSAYDVHVLEQPGKVNIFRRNPPKKEKKLSDSISKIRPSLAKMKTALDFPCDICPRYCQHIECLGHFEVEIIDSRDSSVRQTRSRESQRSNCWQNSSDWLYFLHSSLIYNLTSGSLPGVNPVKFLSDTSQKREGESILWTT